MPSIPLLSPANVSQQSLSLGEVNQRSIKMPTNHSLLHAGQKRKRGGPAAAGVGASPVTSEKLVVKPVEEARGHTGYLTFARRIVEQEEDLEAVLPDPIEPVPNELQS